MENLIPSKFDVNVTIETESIAKLVLAAYIVIIGFKLFK